MRVRVHIGTTEGPAEIQRLTAESPEIRSVVCLDGRAVALPISRDYESFVRRPTGIVERLWGGPAFRMDVGARITDGLSWQLGAFLAHALHDADRLAGRGMAAGAVVWASGEVDASLAVRPVEEIARKLELSATLLREAAAARPWVMVPADAADLARATLSGLGLAETCRVLGLHAAGEALAAIGLALPGAAAPPVPRPIPPPPPVTARAAPKPRRRWQVAAMVAALVLLPVAVTVCWIGWDWRRIVMGWTDQAASGDLIVLDQTLTAMAATPSCLTCGTAVRLFRDWLTAQKPAAGSPAVEAEETRRAGYGGCMAAGGAAPARVALTDQTGMRISVGLCRVRYVVSGTPSVALVVSSPALRQAADSVALGTGEAGVTLDLPPLSIYATEQRIVALGARGPLDKVLAWLRPQLPAAPAALPDGLVARLASMGVGLRVLRHRIDPDRGM